MLTKSSKIRNQQKNKKYNGVAKNATLIDFDSSFTSFNFTKKAKSFLSLELKTKSDRQRQNSIFQSIGLDKSIFLNLQNEDKRCSAG